MLALLFSPAISFQLSNQPGAARWVKEQKSDCSVNPDCHKLTAHLLFASFLFFVIFCFWGTAQGPDACLGICGSHSEGCHCKVQPSPVRTLCVLFRSALPPVTTLAQQIFTGNLGGHLVHPPPQPNCFRYLGWHMHRM